MSDSDIELTPLPDDGGGDKKGDSSKKEKSSKKVDLSVLLNRYKDDKNVGKEVRARIDEYRRENKDSQLPKKWKEFIQGMVGASVKDDKDLCRYLIDFAQELDDKYSRTDMRDSTLYESIVEIYPEAIGLEDIQKYYKKYVTSDDSFGRFCNRVLEHVKKAKDAKFAIKLFDWFKSEGENERAVKYLEKLLDDKDVATEVFNKEFFDNKNRIGEKFATNIKKFADKYKNFDHTQTAVWQQWRLVSEEWKKRNRKRAITITVVILCIIVAIGATLGGLSIWWNSADTSTVSIEGKGIVFCTYGESPDLSAYTVVYYNNNGEKETIPVTSDMLNYDSEIIGQQNATITYNGKTISVTVEISAADIEVPVLSQSGNSVSWRSVDHASSYYLYVTYSATASADKEYVIIKDATSYDFSTASDISGTFYVYIKAMSESEKFNNSNNSERLTLNKLAAVSNVTYNNGYIVWDAVDGADHYMLTYQTDSGKNSVTDIKTSQYEVELSGDIAITVNAYSADSSVISSVGEEVNLHKLSAVTSATYSEITQSDGSTVSRITWTSSEECYYIYSVDDGEYSSAQLANYITVTDWSEGVHSISIICYPMSVNQLQSYAVTYRFSINSQISVDADGVVSWSNIGSIYAVYVDGALSRSGLSVTSFSLENDNISAGEHTISVVADGDIYGKTLTFTKLATPVLSVVDGTSFSTSNKTDYTIWILNGTTYYDQDQLFDLISETAGAYTVTVQNLSTDENVISSEKSEVAITKLSVPVISVKSGELICATEGNVQYYINNSVVDISTLSAGTYSISAKLIASDTNQLNSEFSEAITVTKLAAPVLSYDSTTNTLSIENQLNYTIKYYIGGQEFDGNVSTLSKGSYSVTAKYIGNDVDTLSSSESNAVTIFQTDATISVYDYGGGRARVVLSNMEDGLTYNMTTYFYDKDGNEMETTTLTGQTASSQFISCKRTKGNAYSIKVVVTFTSGDATYTLSASTDISWS